MYSTNYIPLAYKMCLTIESTYLLRYLKVHRCFISKFDINVIFSCLQVLNDTFPNHTFLMNGMIQGIKVRRWSLAVSGVPGVQAILHLL